MPFLWRRRFWFRPRPFLPLLHHCRNLRNVKVAVLIVVVVVVPVIEFNCLLFVGAVIIDHPSDFLGDSHLRYLVLSWKCRQHVATCRRRHNVSLQFWPDGSVSPTQNWRCRGSLCRLKPTFTRFSEFVCRNILWYGSTYAQIPNAHFCHVLHSVMFSSLSCSGTTHTHTTPTRIENTHNSHNE